MIKSITVEDVFSGWIDSCRSEQTKVSYKRVVPQFFEMVFNKELKYIDVSDLDILIPSLVKTEYIDVFISKGFKHSTIINYLKIVASFFGELEINRVYPDINYQQIIHKSLSYDKLKDDTTPRAKMTTNDYEACMHWILNEKEFSKRYAHKAHEYATVLKFMYVTGLRISAVFQNAHWKDIKYVEDYLGQSGWNVMVLDKNDEITDKPISEEYYEELKFAMYKGNDDDLIFKGVSQQGFKNLLKEFSDETDREITAHSIRVGAATKVYATTHDIVATQRFLGHKDIQTTIGYIRTEDRYQTGSSILSSKMDFSFLDDMKPEEVISILKSKKELAYAVMLEVNRRKDKVYG